MKIPRYLCFSVSLIAFVILFPLNNALCGEPTDLDAMKKISIDAINKEYSWTKKFELYPRLNIVKYFDNTILSFVQMQGTMPTTIFIVAIDKRTMNAEVFLHYMDARDYLKELENKKLELSYKEYIEKDINKFSNIIAKESLIIKKINIKDYVESFLYLVSFGSLLKESSDDLPGPYIYMLDFKKKASNVRPIKF